MFYYLTVSYDLHDLMLSEDSELFGPFDTAEGRDAAVKVDLAGRDLETGEVVNVTLLRIQDGDGVRLVRERSFVPDPWTIQEN